MVRIKDSAFSYPSLLCQFLGRDNIKEVSTDINLLTFEGGFVV